MVHCTARTPPRSPPYPTGSAATSPSSTPLTAAGGSVVVVEVQCTAPRSDWPALAQLLRAHLYQCAAFCSITGEHFPFVAGRAVDGVAAEFTEEAVQVALAAHGERGRASRALWNAFPAFPPLLRGAVEYVRVCDMTDPMLLTAGPGGVFERTSPLELPLSTTIRRGENGRAATTGGGAPSPLPAGRAANLSFVPVFFTVRDEPAQEGGGGGVGGAGEELHGDGALPSSSVLSLPHRSLEGLWESLCYGESVYDSIHVKRDLLEYVHAAMLFSLAGVDSHLVAWNGMVLLHGPPGTGKTSLCRALAHKLAVRLCGCGCGSGCEDADAHGGGAGGGSLFSRAVLVDVNAHSLFSRWFSESGKQVMQLFTHIRGIAADARCLVCVLVDEVESLAAARQSAMKGNEPSDSIRVVNALLTQLDRLQGLPNILVLATSNLTSAIDVAFLDRADKKVYVGPPGVAARQTMLYESVVELLDKELLYYPSARSAAQTPGTKAGVRHADSEGEGEEEEEGEPGGGAAAAVSPASVMAALHRIAERCVGFNGRQLKKLPFLAFSACLGTRPEVVWGTRPTHTPWTMKPTVSGATTVPDYTATTGSFSSRDYVLGRGRSLPINTYLVHLQETVKREAEAMAALAAK